MTTQNSEKAVRSRFSSFFDVVIVYIDQFFTVEFNSLMFGCFIHLLMAETTVRPPAFFKAKVTRAHDYVPRS